MSTFFQQTTQAMIAKHIDRFPTIEGGSGDWLAPIEQYLNRQKTRYLRDHRNHPQTEAQMKRNRYWSKTRYVVEQSFSTLHRKFRYTQAAYFRLLKVSA